MDDRLVEVGLELDPRPVATRALDRVGGDQVEAHVSGRLGHRLGPSLAGELDQLADQGGHLVDLLDEVVQQLLARLRRQLVPAREDLDVRLQAGERRAQLVRGVGHELPLSPARVLERAEHRVEARRQPAELVVAGRGRLDPLREIPGLGDRFRRRGQPAHGRQRRARDQQAERCRNRHPPGCDQDQEERDPVQRPGHLRQRPRDLHRVGRGRDRQHPEGLTLEAPRAVVEGLPASRCLAVLPGRGQPEAGARLDEGRPGDRNGLDEIALHADRRPGDVQIPVLDSEIGPGDLAGPLVQRAVDLPEELVVHDDEDRHRSGHDGDADRRGGDQREPGAKAHSSRSA